MEAEDKVKVEARPIYVNTKTLTSTDIFEEWADLSLVVYSKADNDIERIYKDYVSYNNDRFTLPIPRKTFVTKLKAKYKQEVGKVQVIFYYNQAIAEQTLRSKVRGLCLKVDIPALAASNGHGDTKSEPSFETLQIPIPTN